MNPSEKYTDLAIIQKVLSGEIALFEIIIRRNNPHLYKIGRSYNYNHEDTQDLMQDTFIDAFTKLSGYEGRSSFKTWIIKIMLHNCYKKQHTWSSKNVVTADVNEKSIPVFSNSRHSDTADRVMKRELNFVIENALQQIPMDYRMVFTLREVNGLKVSETAEILSISTANVKIRLHRAKAMLRKEVEKSYSAEDIFEFNLIYCDAMVERVMKTL